MADSNQEAMDRVSPPVERETPETPDILKNWAVITYRLHPTFTFEDVAKMLQDMGALLATAESVKEWVLEDALKKVGLHHRIDLRDFRWASWVAKVPLDNEQPRD